MNRCDTNGSAPDNCWTQTNHLCNSAMTYDEEREKVVLFCFRSNEHKSEVWEWDGAAVNTKVERRLQLLDSEKQVIESQPLSYSEATWGSWTHEEISFNAAVTGPHRIALTLTSKPSETPQGCSWTIDHVVVFAPAAEPQ